MCLEQFRFPCIFPDVYFDDDDMEIALSYRTKCDQHMPMKIIRLIEFNHEKIDRLQDLLLSASDDNLKQTSLAISRLFNEGLSMNSIARNLLKLSILRPKMDVLFFKIVEKFQKINDFPFNQLINQLESMNKVFTFTTEVFNPLYKDIKTNIRIKTEGEAKSNICRKHKIVDDFIYNLTEIIRTDEVDKLQMIVSQPDFDIDQKYYFNKVNLTLTCIELAAYYGSIEIFKFLIVNKANIGSENISKYSIIGGNFEIIRILEQYGIKPCFKHIKFAIEFHHKDIFDWLLENNDQKVLPNYLINLAIMVEFYHGIPNEYCYYPYFIFQMACFYSNVELAGFMVEKYEIDPSLGLFIASSRGNFDIVKLLSHNKMVDVNKRVLQSYDCTYILSDAINEAYHERNFDIFEYLFQIPNIDINYFRVLDETNRYGSKTTLLGEAVRNIDLQTIRKLLSREDLNINPIEDVNFTYTTPLISACELCSPNCIELLLSHRDIDVNLATYKNDDVITPLSMAVKHYNERNLWLLLNSRKLRIYYKDFENYSKIIGNIDIVNEMRKYITNQITYIPQYYKFSDTYHEILEEISQP